jgi:hypothetical protein
VSTGTCGKRNPEGCRNGCSASRRGLRVTICPSRAAAIGSGLVDMIGTSRLGDITAGISDPCRQSFLWFKATAKLCASVAGKRRSEAQTRCSFSNLIVLVARLQVVTVT